MYINEETIVIYHVREEDREISEFNTREEANAFIKDRDEHGYNTTMWSVVPEPHYNGN